MRRGNSRFLTFCSELIAPCHLGKLWSAQARRHITLRIGCNQPPYILCEHERSKFSEGGGPFQPLQGHDVVLSATQLTANPIQPAGYSKRRNQVCSLLTNFY